MDKKRARRFLIVAFALSLLIHLILSGVIRWPFRTPDENDVQIVRIEHLHTTRIAHLPSPPAHTPPPAKPIRHVAQVHVAKATAVHAQPAGSEEQAVHGKPSATAAATPTPLGCATSDTPVQLAANAPEPELSPAARASTVTGIARVRVIVGPSGNVEDAAVLESSGSKELDLVAVSMARAAQYTPATHACKAIASTFTYSVRFNPY
jgi:TonB family protein